MDLNSDRWCELSHAYGPATDTPDLLRRIYANPTHDNWSDLYGSVAHQGSISTAAYAAVPHVVAAAEAHPQRARLDYVSFVAFVEIGYDRKPIPESLKPDYGAAVARARELSLSLLAESWDYMSAVYLLQAIAALSGRHTLARIIQGLADEEFQAECPDCGSHLYIQPRMDAFVAFAEDPFRSPESKRTVIRPRKVAAPDSSDEDLCWVSQFAAQLSESRISDQLHSVNGECTCPHCGSVWRLYEILSRLEFG